jgi:hypothetical protein
MTNYPHLACVRMFCGNTTIKVIENIFTPIRTIRMLTIVDNIEVFAFHYFLSSNFSLTNVRYKLKIA